VNPHDITLIKRWNDSRDPDAFAELVRCYAGLVYGSCLRILRNTSDAEDVTQECFMKMGSAPVHVSASLAGWLHTTATRRAINQLRSDSRRSRRFLCGGATERKRHGLGRCPASY
jgi:DNA-directed RNA polymerase specialized sigma24 family protein